LRDAVVDILFQIGLRLRLKRWIINNNDWHKPFKRLAKSNTQNEQHLKTIMHMHDLMEQRGTTEEEEENK
jgi:hypothetical protein